MLGSTTLPCDWIEIDGDTAFYKGKLKGNVVGRDRFSNNKTAIGATLNYAERIFLVLFIVSARQNVSSDEKLLREIRIDLYFPDYERQKFNEHKRQAQSRFSTDQLNLEKIKLLKLIESEANFKRNSSIFEKEKNYYEKLGFVKKTGEEPQLKST